MLCHCGNQTEEGQPECRQCKFAMEELRARLNYKSEQALIRNVRSLLHSHKVVEAKSLLEERLCRVPNDGCALALNAVVSLIVDNRIGAISSLTKAVDSYPNWDAVLLLAELQRRAGKVDDAYATLRKGLAEGERQSKSEKALRAYDQLSFLLIKNRKWVQALEIYDELRVCLRERIMDEIVAKVRCFQADSTINRAGKEKDLIKFSREIPAEMDKSLSKLAILFNNMGVCFAATGKYDDARRLFLRSIEFTPDGCETEAATNLTMLESSGQVETRNLRHRMLDLLSSQPLSRRKGMRVRFVFFNQPYEMLGISVPLITDGAAVIEIEHVT